MVEGTPTVGKGGLEGEDPDLILEASAVVDMLVAGVTTKAQEEVCDAIDVDCKVDCKLRSKLAE